MTTIDTSHIAFPGRFLAYVQHAFPRLRRRMATPEHPEDARACRAFVQEMLSRNPAEREPRPAPPSVAIQP